MRPTVVFWCGLMSITYAVYLACGLALALGLWGLFMVLSAISAEMREREQRHTGGSEQ